MALTDSIAEREITGIAADSLGVDSLLTPESHVGNKVIQIIPTAPAPKEAGEGDNAVSWVISGLVLLFVVACLRYRKNTRYFSILLRDVFEMKERHNAFDDTLRETLFLWLLNLLWCGSAGVLIYGAICGDTQWSPLEFINIRQFGICVGMAFAYTIFLNLAYLIVGNVFSDNGKATLWVKGYMSIQALETIVMFPIAILGICSPGLMGGMIICGIIVFILAKLLFIYKGFCIFFTETASWVLFLYYLCSLEIVPIVLTYASASYLCNLM